MSYQPSTSTIINHCQGIVKDFLQYFSDKCKINADTWETLIPSAYRYATFILTFLIFGEIWVFMGIFGGMFPHPSLLVGIRPFYWSIIGHNATPYCPHPMSLKPLLLEGRVKEGQE